MNRIQKQFALQLGVFEPHEKWRCRKLPRKRKSRRGSSLAIGRGHKRKLPPPVAQTSRFRTTIAFHSRAARFYHFTPQWQFRLITIDYSCADSGLAAINQGMDLTSSTDAQLLRRYARNGNEFAFTELVQRHLGLIYRSLCENRETTACWPRILHNRSSSFSHARPKHYRFTRQSSAGCTKPPCPQPPSALIRPSDDNGEQKQTNPNLSLRRFRGQRATD